MCARLSVLAVVLLVLNYSGRTAAQTSIQQFRGLNGDGVYQAVDVPTEFGADSHLVWRTELPGKGWSSPIVTDDKTIWVTAAIEIFPSEEERLELLESSGVDLKKFKVRQVAKSIKLVALEVSLKDGQLNRQIELTTIEAPDPIHSLNSYASPTPCLEGNFLYTHFGTFGTFCLDIDSGAVKWQTRLLLEHGVGPGSSPLLHQDRLILICDGIDQQYVAAIDKATGKELWRKSRPEMDGDNGDRHKAYSTPIVIAGKGGDDFQVICMGAQWLVSYNPIDGEENWKLKHGSGFSVVPRPVFNRQEELIYVSTGFGAAELWAIDPQGKVQWKDTKRIPTRPSPLLVGDELYVINDQGIASCFDAASGALHWSERITGNYSASPIYAGGHIYVCNHEGEIAVFKPGTSYSPVVTNQIGEQIMASPVALDGQLIIRSAEALYLFGDS